MLIIGLENTPDFYTNYDNVPGSALNNTGFDDTLNKYQGALHIFTEISTPAGNSKCMSESIV